MGCDCTKEDSRTKTLTENDEGNKLNNADNKVNNKMVINANKKKVTVYENYKKETQKGLTILENVKEILPKDISKESIKDMVYNALGNTIVKDKSKFIKGVNITKEHAQTIIDVLYNIVHKKENGDENENENEKKQEDIVDNTSLKDVNVIIGFYDATEENVRKFMFKKKNPTDEEVKKALNQLTAGDVDAKILAIEIKDE